MIYLVNKCVMWWFYHVSSVSSIILDDNLSFNIGVNFLFNILYLKFKMLYTGYKYTFSRASQKNI